MRNSGIEWIGEIPDNWNQIRLKNLFKDRCGGSWGDETKGDENDIICIRVADFDFEKQIVKDGNKTVRNYNPQLICKLMLQENDLLIEKSGGGEKTPVGRTILAKGCQGFLYANFIDRLRIRTSNNPQYVAYLFRTLYCCALTFPYIKQTTGIQNLDVENLLREFVSVPAIKEQQRIADYLDKKCAEIDSLISHEKRIIEELKAYKQSVVTEAVTKGLDKSEPMKDSKIWHGQIPNGWIIKRGKYVFKERNERGNKIKLQLLSPTQKYGVIPQELYEELSGMNAVKLNENANYAMLKTIHKGDYCISLRSFQGGFEYSEYEGVVSPAYQVFYSIINIHSGYYKYLFKEKGFINVMNSYTMSLRDGKNISFENFGKTFIPVPPLDVQQLIADYLDKKCAEIDSLVSVKQQKIEELKEYKKSLIYEYVTGKKEIENV